MPRVTHLRTIALTALVSLAALAFARSAAASYPCSTYVVPSLVELQPSDDAATRVVIHGAFLQLTSDTTMSYGDPRCGVMSFACVAGQEAMCRMQWKELRDAVATPQFCAGFGSWNVLSVATVYDEGAPLGSPDPWDLGMGIAQGVYVDNKCPPARQLVCPPSAGDGGAMTDAAPPADAAPDDAAPAMDVAPPRDGSSDQDAAPVRDASADHTVGTDAGTDAAPHLVASGWCAIATPTPLSVRVCAIVLAALFLLRRRRDGGR